MKVLLVGALAVAWLCLAGSVTAGDVHDAARRGDLQGVISILSLDPTQLNAQDQLGDTALSLSAAYARWEVFHYLLDRGADVNVIARTNSTPMHCACYHDCPEMVELLLQKGATPSLQVKDVFGEYTPMLRAVQRGNRNVVSFLLEHGARSDETTTEGWNALHLAAKCGHRHLYGLLIERGVSLDALDHAGKKPLAYDFRRPEAVSMDIERYAEYVGRYCWLDDPEGPCVRIFLQGDELLLDDNCLNSIYPIGDDLFYCSHDPWKIEFFRDAAGEVDRVELAFLRRHVALGKVE
jgi:hypothetical protein